MNTLSNGSLLGEETVSPYAGLTPGIIPEAESTRKGVSVRYAPSADNDWYVLRASYGRELKVRDLLIDLQLYAHVAQRYEVRLVQGKRRKVLASLLPNLVFVYAPRTQIDFIVKGPNASFVADYNLRRHSADADLLSEERLDTIVRLSTLSSFYYNHFETIGYDGKKNPPLTIHPREMESFIRATSTKSVHLKQVDLSKCRFKNDQLVQVVQGDYAGVIGRIARVAGQQCIVVSLANGKWNISTDYIPTPFIRVLK